MDPLKDQRLRAWLAPVLKHYGQWIERTPEGHKDYVRLGRWSRWGQHGVLETHVNLEALAVRVRSKLNEPKPPREFRITDYAFTRQGLTDMPHSR